MKLFQTKDIKVYKPILEGLTEDFGYTYYHAILIWCGIIDDDPDDVNKFWDVYLVKDNSKIIGICGLYSHNHRTDELWLGWFGILPEHRSKGVGSQVLKELEEKAKSVKCYTIYSYVDKHGKPLNFYKREGYKVLSRVKDYLGIHKELSMDSFEDENDYIIMKKL